jgi:TetR/AcrR family transcriptional regulator, transcriptional repressor for nem operon
MARPKEFDREQALDAAIGVFREHGFEGTSTAMLVQAMGVGRQSLYDTFGDKWQLYCAAVHRYASAEVAAHAAALDGRPRAIDGIRAMVERVVDGARDACLGVGSICEFGRARPELAAIQDAAGRVLGAAILRHVRAAQAEGDIAAEIDPAAVAGFFVASFAGIRVAARGGAGPEQLRLLGELTLRALR